MARIEASTEIVTTKKEVITVSKGDVEVILKEYFGRPEANVKFECTGYFEDLEQIIITTIVQEIAND